MSRLPESFQAPTDDRPVESKDCPICGSDTIYIYPIEELDGYIARYYRCRCGVIFQENPPSENPYDNEYLKKEELKPLEESRGTYSARIYAPIIEEATYGRMMLDVGFAVPYTMGFMEDRGWLVWGIDKNKDIEGGGSIYQGDYETYDFSPRLNKEQKKQIGMDEVKRTFDLIWMSHVLEKFKDPIKALKKAYDLLAMDGCLHIATTDIDFIHKHSLAHFGEFKHKENYVLWSMSALVRELKKVGFKIMMKRRNYSTRFKQSSDIHIIAQKNRF